MVFTGSEFEGFDKRNKNEWEQNGPEKEDEANTIGSAGDFATCHHFVDEVTKSSDSVSLTDGVI